MKEEVDFDLYTSLEEAKKEVHRRWNNEALRKEVKEYIGTLPPFLLNEPKACLSRFITTPNFEFLKFMELAGQIQLPPVSAEYRSDNFCSQNCDKHALGKLHFYHKRNKKGAPIFAHKTVVDFSSFEAHPLRSVLTLWNEPLIDFHHRLLQSYSLDLEIVDASGWLRVNGDKAEEYYCHYLALFICHAVLFENFITNEEEERFSRSIVFPSFKQVINHFGLKPLIVPLVPHEDASDIYWRCYPADMEEEILRCLCQCEAKKSSEQHDEARRGARHGHNG
jgi:hypothetical protein